MGEPDAESLAGRSGRLITAADGMPVRPIPLPGAAFMGAAIGYLAPGASYAVHYHLALEQLTYVLRGRVSVTTGPTEGSGEATELLEAGSAAINPPGVTLSFSNPFAEPAEVLFVCAPPFPVDGADVALAGVHRRLDEAERARARTRLAWALDHFRAVGEARRP